jgi:hypothetical protein
LLKVLFTEQGDVRPHRAQQFCNDRRNTVEMPGPRLPFPAVADSLHADRRREASWIDFAGPRKPEQVAARLLQHGGVLLFLAGIAIEVLVRAELERIDEDRRCDTVGDTPCFRDQFEMPGVERAHRRNERQTLPARPQGNQG